MRYPGSPGPKRWMLGVAGTQSGCAAANAISIPAGEYGRKAETQRNWRGPAQAVEHVVQFDATRRTLPGLERLVNGGGNTFTPQGGPVEVLHGCRQLVS